MWEEEKALMLLKIYEVYINSGENVYRPTNEELKSGGRVNNKYVLDRLKATSWVEYMGNNSNYVLSESAIRLLEKTEMVVDKIIEELKKSVM